MAHGAGGARPLRPVPEGRWGLPRDEVVPGPGERDRAWTDRGGYVTGFEEVLDPTGFAVPASELDPLDPLFRWVLHTARAAILDAGGRRDLERTGAIFGLLSFPSAGMARFAEGVWLGERGTRADPRERFMSGLPALLLQKALGLGGEAFTLDAACASSLYAIKLACDALHDDRADCMLAGAVCRADDLFIHVGFSALKALSRSGRSRPFHRDADGLVPAEGAGFVVLRRLDDARRDGDRVLGVIRGIGLANDGRGRGFLAPSRRGSCGPCAGLRGRRAGPGLDLPARVPRHRHRSRRRHRGGELRRGVRRREGPAHRLAQRSTSGT